MRATCVALGIVLLTSHPSSAGTEVTSCGQEVTAITAFLTADLDCTGQPLGVRMRNGGTLDLRGFTLTGGDPAVYCSKDCRIVSEPPGGEITGSAGDGVIAPFLGSSRSVAVSDVKITGNAGRGVGACRVRAYDAEISNNGQHGIETDDTYFCNTVVKRSVISGNGGTGVGGTKRVRLVESTVSNNQEHGVFSVAVFADSSDISANGIDGITLNDFGPYRQLRRVAIVKESTISGNARFGILSCALCAPIVLSAGTATGNGTDASCGDTQACADLAGADAPMLRDGASCGTSYDTGSGFPGSSWDVCTSD